MKLLLALGLSLSCAAAAQQGALRETAAPFLTANCLDCHDEDTETRFNVNRLGTDLDDPKTFRTWLEIYDRVDRGEMPPRKKKKRPAKEDLEGFLSEVRRTLHRSNAERQRSVGRVPIRRLTRLEYEYSLHDLLSIKTPIKNFLPIENSSGFDTLGKTQGISSHHVRAYLTAAEHALKEAIVTGKRPRTRPYIVNYRTSTYTKIWYDRSWMNGGDNLREVKDGVASFKRTDFIWRTDRNGFIAKRPGTYKVVADVYAFQARTPVTLSLYRATGAQSDQQTVRLLRAFDLQPDESRKVEVTTYLRTNDYILPSFENLQPQKDGRSLFQVGAKKYTGEGIVIRSIKIEGPIFESWPPRSSTQLLCGHDPKSKEDVERKVEDVVRRIGPRAFRRPLGKRELRAYVAMAQPAIDQHLSFGEAVRLPLRAILTSPQFLMLSAGPGKLDDYALATRLSYFLWKSLPDEQLVQAAQQGKLSQNKVLAEHVERMLRDPKAMRFAHDFVGQWLRLDDIDDTTPDKALYPEYSDILRQAMLDETRLFFMELIRRDLGTRHLIDSDFTFVNRELAELYRVPDVTGQQMRKVKLPAKSPRGGLLAQAAILKVTANGTTTSPVKRGNFVLHNLLGTPTPPPPADIGSIEPDIRGATTIRETLAAHREVKSCNRCHQHIDPPGFALECFDVIGGYRTRYRRLPAGKARRYQMGLPIDTHGTTFEGRSFETFEDYQAILLADEAENATVTRHLVAQLITYATGGEIQFADRSKVDRITERQQPRGSPLRSLIHEVVQSGLFRNK